MDVQITPTHLAGTLNAISSKSFAHRLLICAALADAPTLINLNGFSEDINATIRCLQEMGCSIEANSDSVQVGGSLPPEFCEAKLLKYLRSRYDAPPSTGDTPVTPPSVSSIVLDCGESGATARFLLPLAALLFDRFTLTGKGRLPGRPFAPLCQTLAAAGCTFDSDTLPLTGTGRIRAGDFSIQGDVSSQFISGLLFALPLLDGDSGITLTTALESAAYVDMTIEALGLFGIQIEKHETGFRIKGNQRYRSPGTVSVEGDWSNAAFFLCMGAFGGPVSLQGLSPDSSQGDKAVADILRRFGATVESSAGGCNISTETLHGIDIDASQIPDLVPTLAVVASVALGETRIYNAQRLRIKESDRIQSTFDMLSALGADVKITADGLLIKGKERLRGGAVNGAGDHRIVMAAATAACVCENPVLIKGCEAVNKSYPSFFDDYRAIGGTANVVQSGQ